jgi:hypothetical protein
LQESPAVNAAVLSACSPNQRTVAFVHNGAKMSQLGSKDAKQRYEIPSDMSVHDFVRRAVAEAKLIIAEIDKTQAEMEAPKLA